jgi:hypothetical protein
LVTPPLIENNFDIVLFGHTHVNGANYSKSLLGSTFYSISPSTIADNSPEKKYINGYSIIDFVKDEKIVAKFRKYVSEKTVFVNNTDIGNDEGEYTYIFPTKDEAIRQKNNSSLIDKIKDIHTDSLNQHLITYSSKSNEYNSIDGIFVEPSISNNPQIRDSNENKKDEEIITYNIEGILSSTENFLISGAKEAGKTILIDKLFIELTTKFYEYNQIPILIPFQDMGNQDIITICKQFLNKSSEEVRKILKDGNVTFLIDNIAFENKNKHKINKFINLLDEFENSKIRIIATYFQFVENVLMPTEYNEQYEKSFKFSLCFLHDFNGKQIRELIQKWFVNKKNDYQENIEKLIKSFQKCSLKRTPLSVTMFLWIIEKQEKKHINNSNLVEMFVENLLEKANFENVFNSAFDFKDKLRLLAHIAKFMLDFGDNENSYSCPNHKIIEYTEKYLKNKTNDSPIEIIENLVERRILTKQCESISFKSSFFFHFFLANYMDINEEFKRYVLNEKNYLQFIDEIDYYTGLKRNAEDVLEFTQDRLMERYSDFNQALNSESGLIDRIFDTKDTFSEKVELSKVKKPSNKEIEESYDRNFDNLPSERKIESKKSTEHNTINIGAILKLASIVLKNSSDVDDQKRKLAYKNILVSSISFVTFYRQVLIEQYKSNNDLDFLPKNIDINFFFTVIPIMHQLIMTEWLSSTKLQGIIKDKIDNDSLTLNISEFERFLSTYIYSDLRMLNYEEVVKKYVKTSQPNYIKDQNFFKILTYYFIRSKNENSDKLYLDLLADIQINTKKIKPMMKTRFIENLRKAKEKKNGKPTFKISLVNSNKKRKKQNKK